jgi:hypothetical protein
MPNEWRVFAWQCVVIGVVFALIAILGGCAEWNAAKIGVASHGAQASDAALEASLWQVCYASPVGAVRRRFQSELDIKAWQQFCHEANFAP